MPKSTVRTLSCLRHAFLGISLLRQVMKGATQTTLVTVCQLRSTSIVGAEREIGRHMCCGRSMSLVSRLWTTPDRGGVGCE